MKKSELITRLNSIDGDLEVRIIPNHLRADSIPISTVGPSINMIFDENEESVDIIVIGDLKNLNQTERQNGK